MKSVFYSFIVGMILGGGGIYCLLNISTPARATMTVSSSDPDTKITGEHLEVKSKRKLVEAISSFETDRAGVYTNTISINRSDLQYNNSISGQVGYLLTSQTILADLGYSYKNLIISAKIGYSFRLQEIEYGLAIGGKVSW